MNTATARRFLAFLDRWMPVPRARAIADGAVRGVASLLVVAVLSPDVSAAMQAHADALAWQSGLAVGLCAGVLGGLVIGAGLGLFLRREPKA